MGRFWRWPLEPYVGEVVARDPQHPEDPLRSSETAEILRCPSDGTAESKYDRTSYGYSAAFYHSPGQIAGMTTEDLWEYDRFPCVTQQEEWVSYPAQKVFVAEWATNHDSRTKTETWWSWKGSRNYLFADGHAAYLAATRLQRDRHRIPRPERDGGRHRWKGPAVRSKRRGRAS